MAAFGILIFFSYQLGMFHLNSDDYVPYKVQFADVNGLLKKADVKMAGVKIGWVDDLHLVENSQVLVSIKIKKECCIYENAAVSIKQDGMLGGKFIDLYPGNSTYPLVSSGNFLKAALPQAGIDDVMRDFRSLSHQVELLTSNVNVFLTQVSGQGSVISDAQTVLKETAQLVSLLQEMVQHNKGSLYSSVECGNTLLSDLQKYLPELADRLKQTTETVESIAGDAHMVIKKVNNADGSIGKLLNDDTLHQNIYNITQDVENAVSFFKNIDFVLDARVEGATHHHGFFNGTKAFFDLRIHPCRDYFGIIGLVASQCGYLRKFDHLECCANELHQKTTMLIKRNKPLLNLQIARILGDCVCAVRAGVFQSTPGIGFDVQIPLINPFRWVSTLELYDLMGTQRLYGHDPYLKWYNRLFFGEHVYAEIGIDDIINAQGRHAIFGAGIRFADDELLKCFLN
jgi:phospholipid/cholesterol/gamma-HCH transport system substrate-binding protein